MLKLYFSETEFGGKLETYAKKKKRPKIFVTWFPWWTNYLHTSSYGTLRARVRCVHVRFLIHNDICPLMFFFLFTFIFVLLSATQSNILVKLYYFYFQFLFLFILFVGVDSSFDGLLRFLSVCWYLIWNLKFQIPSYI